MIQYLRKFFLILAFSIIYSCTKDSYRQKFKEELQIDIGISYKVISSKTDFAIGDFSQEIDLQFDSLTIKKIINQIRSSTYFSNKKSDVTFYIVETELGESHWFNWEKGYVFKSNLNDYQEFIVCTIDSTANILYYQYTSE